MAANTFSYLTAILAFAGFAQAQVIIPGGTKITARLEQALSSATAQEGQAVNLTVVDNVKVGEVVVIPQGATVVGTITESLAKRRMGRTGKLDFSIDKVRAIDGDFIPLRYSPVKKEGGSHAVRTGVITAGVAAVFWPAAPFVLLAKGKDVNIQRGISLDVFTDADHIVRLPHYASQTAGAPAIPPSSSTSTQNPASLPLLSNASFAGSNPVVSAPAPQAAPVELVAVTIQSDVSGAEVEIDGAFVGNAPLTRRLAPGNHKILVKDGDQLWERVLAVQIGEAVTVQARLAATPPAPPAPTRTARR